VETTQRRGPLVIIGGHEDKEHECVILKEFVRLAGGSDARIVVMTVATEQPQEVGREYRKLFCDLGAGDVRVVGVTQREEARSPQSLKTLDQATGVFFTGGDQLRITALLGGTPMDDLLHRAHEEGLALAGTSSGASMMSCTMIIEGDGKEAPAIDTVGLSPGMKFIEGPIIDQHFAERGRIGRLLSAVAQQPAKLGLGLDEDTAIVVRDGHFRVLGSGAVTVLDGRNLAYTNLDDGQQTTGYALFGVQLHILPAGYGFDLAGRAPLTAEDAKSRGGRRH
jgi:cyanophycinase